MVSTPKVEYAPDRAESKGMPKRQAAVGDVLPDAPVPQPKTPKKSGILSRLFESLFGTKKTPVKRQQTRHTRKPQQKTNSHYNKNQRTDRNSRDQYRGRARRTNSTGTNRLDDNRADGRRPTRNTNKPNTRGDSRTRTRDNGNRRPPPSTNKPDTHGDSRTRNQEDRSEKSASDRPRQRQTQRSRSPRRSQTPKNTPREEQSKPIKKTSRPEPILEKKIEPAVKPQAKPAAPRRAHTPSTPKQTDARFEQVETAHKPKTEPSHAKQNTPERPRRQRVKKPVEKTSPEEFEMIETKN